MTWFTCCKSDRVFFFSSTAQTNPQFDEYKNKLEDAVNWYDFYSSVLLYTPHATAFTYALVSAIQAGLDSNSSYSTLFSIFHIGIPILSTCIMGASKAAQKPGANTVKKLISDGVQLGFFQITPADITNSEPSDHKSLINDDNDDEHKLHTDALSHRILATV